MNLKLIACEILYREFSYAVARSVNRVDMEVLPKGLHDIGHAGMREKLQQAINAVDTTRYDAILLGYALCSNGLVGLTAPGIPLVVARGHDCITLFLGDRQRYLTYFQAHPGAFYKTMGWIERGSDMSPLRHEAIQTQSGMTNTYEELVAKYGEDNAKFLYEELCNMTRNYAQFTYIRMGIEPDDRFERQVAAEAERNGWQFEAVDGDLRLIQHLVDGPWDDERYLVVPPGQRVAASYDERVVKLEPS